MNSLHRMLLSTNVKCPNMENCFLSSLEASKLAIPQDSCSENVIKPITVVGKQVNSSLKNPCASLK